MSSTGELIDRKRSRSVRRGAEGKGRSRFSARTYELRHKPIPRQPPSLPQARFGGGPMEKGRVDRHLASGLPYDITTTVTAEEGQVCVFVAVDHCTSECIGIHASLSGNRFEALEPLRQGVREHFGGFDEGTAAGLAIRHDHGSAYMSDDFQRELTFLGIV